LTGIPDPRYGKTMGKEFNLAQVSAVSWSRLEPTRGQIDFSIADAQVALAQSKQQTICGDSLLLAASPYIPDWLAKGNFSREELAQILRDHLVQVISRYRGRISQYVVAEDPYPAYEQDVFYPKFGYDYIDLAFQIARETDPSAVLIFNLLNNETSSGTMTPLTRQIVQRLKSKGLIDGVGVEMHLDANKSYAKQDVIATMQSYGVPVYVTEIDVNLKDVPGTQEERYAKQAKIYGDMFAACLESGVCKSFSVWDIGDKYSWLERESPNADPTPFDNNLNPKPAYFALLDLLR
jgi:endo-1,4-beta-xylanase